MNEKPRIILTLLVKGSNLAHKVAFISSVSGIGVVPSIGIDFGQLSFDVVGDEAIFYMFLRKDSDDYAESLLSDTGNGFLGFIYMLDSSAPETFHKMRTELIAMNKSQTKPIATLIVVLNSLMLGAWDTESLQIVLRIPPEIPIIPCVATDKQSVANVLIALCEEVLRDMEKEEASES